MINFSTLKGLTIPEGNVTQIADASGRVLWKQAPSGATIFISFIANGPAAFSSYASVTVDGVEYPVNADDLTTEGLIVPIGTVITCKANKTTLNGTIVASGLTEYQYTVVGDATIEANVAYTYNPMTGASYSGAVTIQEISEGYAAVAITGDVGSPNNCCVSVDGKKYYQKSTLYLPIGTQVACFVKQTNSSYDPGLIFINGVEVFRDTSYSGANYNYTVNGNALITIDYHTSGNQTACVIYITEL